MLVPDARVESGDQFKYLLTVAAKSELFEKIEYDRSERGTKSFIHGESY